MNSQKRTGNLAAHLVTILFRGNLSTRTSKNVPGLGGPFLVFVKVHGDGSWDAQRERVDLLFCRFSAFRGRFFQTPVFSVNIDTVPALGHSKNKVIWKTKRSTLNKTRNHLFHDLVQAVRLGEFTSQFVVGGIRKGGCGVSEVNQTSD
jgi:hypothetical protein